ncbi:hypothetical protein PS880_06105 [Pseudomonas fluorescens]|uniref:Uncharacterized protein n=1 Tax=Pseudomonas fluorescens TaxID=294 RepID=A0A5E7QMI2_PSEFL|nr:hypothetical protein PS880_06105 [Pseudomonas fluorescens]
MAAIQISSSGGFKRLWDVHHPLASYFASSESLAEGLRP